LVYRHYQAGDEEGLAALFNVAFQSLGAGFLRTPRLYHWRYVQRPGYRPEDINLCEDPATGRIVGSVMGTIEECGLGGEQHRVGAINDVATWPGYGGRGIARRLMEMAHQHFGDHRCRFAILTADPGGFPRAKIYCPMGYVDWQRLAFYVAFADLCRLARYQPLLGLAAPALALTRIPGVVRRSGWGTECRQARLRVTAREAPGIREFVNRASIAWCDGLHPLPPGEWAWQNAGPIPLVRPSWSTLLRGPTVVGAAWQTSQVFYLTKFGFRIRMGALRNPLLDPQEFHTSRSLDAAYGLLLNHALQATKRRGAAITLCTVGANNTPLRRALRRTGFVGGVGGTFMVKDLTGEGLPDTTRSLIVPYSEAMGYP
jgi:GNAT superfamily N-acetyltransferase